MSGRRPSGMRVIAGAARGVLLRAPRDHRTRPTASRLRESMFSMLEAAGDDLSEVLDLYAGSGALGIEALSRGGQRCTFVESETQACRVIRDNLRHTKMESCGEIIRAKVGRWKAPSGAGYTLVLADPPYDRGGAWKEIEHSLSRALATTAILVVEHAARQTPPSYLLGRSMIRTRRQGEGAISIYRPPNEINETPVESSTEGNDAL